MAISHLPLENMHERHDGLTQAVADYYLEAARICLDRNFLPPQEFNLRSENFERVAIAEWEPPDERCKKAWANKNDATRDGAYACALAATELCLDLYAISRAESLTGADHYIAPKSQPLEDLENCYRLEVSGTDKDYAEVKKRLAEKILQARSGKSNLPAITAIVGFKVKLIYIKKVED